MGATLVISPHLDDAVWSLGQFIAATPDVTVLTILAGIPPEGMVTTYDAACGFGTSAQSVRERRAENARAMTVLGAQHIECEAFDGQYGVTDTTGLADLIRIAIDNVKPDHLLIPLGLHHPDHVAVSDAAMTALDALRLLPPVPVGFYEELPYRVWFPEEVPERLKVIDGVSLVASPAADVETKRAAVECYRSQLSDDIRRCIYVPERVWWRT